MLVFDVTQAPPTRQEIDRERQRLLALKKHAFKSGMISDAVHAVVLFALYFSGLLSGTAFLAAVLVGSVIALILAFGSSRENRDGQPVAQLLTIGCVALTVGGLTILFLEEPLVGGIIAGLATASISFSGRLLGRRIMQVLTALEGLETIDEEHPAHAELLVLCRQFPPLADYRQQARDILRPLLTQGELQAMRVWAGKRSAEIVDGG